MSPPACAAAAAFAAAVLAAGCAADPPPPAKAPGFSAFLEQIATRCQPLYAGALLITPDFLDPAWDLQTYKHYDQWLDQTSRLYYRKLSPQAYLDAIGARFGERSFESARCTVAQLPPLQR